MTGWRHMRSFVSACFVTVFGKQPRSLLGKLGFRALDATIRVRVLIALIRRVSRGDIAGVCIGELVASSWILNVARLFPRMVRAVYVHGEEITTLDEYDADLRRRRRALLHAQRIFVVSHFTAAATEGLLGEDAAGRIQLIENGVDTQRFRPVPRRENLAARYGLHEEFVFISVCRLLQKKGVDHALCAFARILKDEPESRFLIVGEGPFQPELERIAAELAITDQVIFAGAVPDDQLIDHYALGDVFVMPNRRLPNGDTEGFGLVFLEANACGLPVIAGLDGGSTDAVRDRVNGLLVDGHSVDAIASAMAELRHDPALRETLRSNGLETSRVADWSYKARAFLQVFDDAMPT